MSLEQASELNSRSSFLSRKLGPWRLFGDGEQGCSSVAEHLAKLHGNLALVPSAIKILVWEWKEEPLYEFALLLCRSRHLYCSSQLQWMRPGAPVHAQDCCSAPRCKSLTRSAEHFLPAAGGLHGLVYPQWSGRVYKGL